PEPLPAAVRDCGRSDPLQDPRVVVVQVKANVRRCVVGQMEVQPATVPAEAQDADALILDLGQGCLTRVQHVETEADGRPLQGLPTKEVAQADLAKALERQPNLPAVWPVEVVAGQFHATAAS